MTASEAREAADFFRREVAIGEQMIAAPCHPLIDASEHGQGVADIAKVTAFKRAAAVALDAYADGIDRPETRGMLDTADAFAKAAANHVPAVGSAPAIVAFYELERSQYALAATALRRCAAPEFLPTSSDTNRLHRIRARLIALVPLDGTMSMADDVQRLDRALADAAAVEREACALLADRTEARWREQERTSDDDFTRSRCFARADVAATLARAIRARASK